MNWRCSQRDVVGTYFTFSKQIIIVRGFLLRGRAFYNIDVDLAGAIPGSTNAIGINSRFEIVGFYTDTNGNPHGFLLRAGTFTNIDVPGSTFTTTTGISEQSDVLGFYIDSSGNGHRYLLSRGTF